MNHHPSSSWIRLGAILLLTLFVRAGYLYGTAEPFQFDTDLYRQIAQTLRVEGTYGRQDLEGRTWPTAFRPPLYPLLLSISSFDRSISPTGIATLHLLLGLATVATTWLIARNYDRGNGGGWHPELAAMAVAIDPLLLVQSSQIMTETLAAFLATAALLCLLQLEQRQSRVWGFASGLTLGCAALCRPTFLPWCVLVLLLQVRKTVRKRTAVSLMSLALGMTLALCPWALRNYGTLGRWIVSTTHGGYTLLLGNNPEYYAHLRDVNREHVWTAEPAHEAVNAILAEENLNLVRDEITLDARLAERAKQHMRNDIPGCTLACIDRIQQLWSPLIRKEAGESSLRCMARYIICVCYLGVYAAAIVGAVRGWNSSQRPLVLFAFALAISFTAVHTIYWSNLRMRSPLMPAIYLLAAGSIIRSRSSAGD